jgi:holo-[acyl-carrier protein] synthase
MILGIGCDLIDIKRVAKLYEENSEKFLARILSLEEKTQFNSLNTNIKNQYSYLAKRFAGKEAVSKAFGIGIGSLSFVDISILNDEKGAPYVIIPPKFQFQSYNHFDIKISLSDEENMALAFVVISL